MKRLLIGLFGVMLAANVLPFAGCSEVVAHHESDKPRLFGGRQHEEKTVIRNPDGSYTTEESRTKY